MTSLPSFKFGQYTITSFYYLPLAGLVAGYLWKKNVKAAVIGAAVGFGLHKVVFDKPIAQVG